MAGPWEDYSSGGDSMPWEDFGGEAEVPKKKGKSPAEVLLEGVSDKKATEDYINQLRGLAEGGLSTLTGMFGGGLGQLSGLIAGARQHGVGTDEQRRLVEAEAARQGEALTFQPRTEQGKTVAANIGKGMEQLIPIMPLMPQLEGAMMATRGARALKKAAQPPRTAPPGGFAPDVPLPLDEAIAQAEKAPENQRMGPPTRSSMPWEDYAPEAPRKESLRAREQFQPSLFPEEGEGVIAVSGRGEAVPMSAEAARVRPPEVALEAQRFAEAEALRQQEQAAKLRVEQGETGNLFGDYINKSRDYELFRDEDGRPLSRKDFDTTVDNLAKEPSTAYVRPENMDEAYSKYLSNFEGVQAGLFDQPTTAIEMAQALKNDAAVRMRNTHPLVKAAERFVNQEQQFLDQLKQQGANAEVIKQAADDVTKAQARLDKTISNVEKGLKGGTKPQAVRKQPKRVEGKGGEITYMYEGLGESIRRVGAWTGILSAANNKQHAPSRLENRVNKAQAKLDYMPQHVKEGLGDYTKERRDVDTITQDILENNIPDIKGGSLTRAADKFQAGGLYKGLETNNPLVRKTFAAVSDAYNNAHSNIRTFIQDKKEGLPALFRQLNKKEAGDWWAARQVAEGEMNFTPEQMREMGMNEKQIALNTRLNEALDFAFERINEARALVGKGPVDRRVGYLAGQMTGDFRNVIYKKGTKEVVGVIGGDVRLLKDRRLKRLLEQHPEWEAGPEKMANRQKRDSRQKAFEDAVEMMADENPDTKNLLDAYDQMLKDDAYNYMNAKKHTMQKKGVFGTEGFKRDVDAWTNAKQGMQSQIRYLEKMMNWAEMSKAVNEVKPLLTNDQINMPNAKRWSSDYIDRALGIQTSDIGHALDGVLNAVGKSVGVGPSAIERGVGVTKGAISKTLLGFINPMFLAINLMQPAVALPAMNSLLRSRGIQGAGMHLMPQNMLSFMKMSNEGLGKLTPFEAQIKKEGLQRNLFGSEIFDHTTHLRRAGYALNKVAEVGIPAVEGTTRGIVFTHFANVLKKDGRYKGRELFDIAENLTNQAMTDYRNIEAPSIYKEMGAMGEMAVTLQRYKHNSLSSMAMLGREAARNKSYRPLATSVAVGVAFSGLTGMIGFNEADKLYQTITSAMGKPDTLTRLLMEHLPDTANFGVVSTLTGINMSKRFGMQLFPDSPSGVLFPGASRLAEAGEGLYNLAKNPMDETTQLQALRGVAPNSVRGIIDATAFQDESGMAYNPRTLQATVERTPMDVAAKYLGGTGLTESKQKASLYQQNIIDKQFAARRQSAIDAIEKELYPLRGNPEGIADFFESDRGQELKDKFIESEGDVKALIGAVKRIQKGFKLTEEQRKLLGAKGQPQRAKRYVEALKNEEVPK